MTIKQAPGLIIFDCDGVLVDSETLAAEVFSHSLSNHGVQFSAEACMKQFRGLTLSACLLKLNNDFGVNLPEGFLSELREATQIAFANGLRAINGVEPVLTTLARHSFKYCVASNGGVDKVHHSLTVTGLLPLVEGRCFSAEQVSAGKPAPDLFLYAAAQMGVEARECWVVEDSPAGVRAGVAAGMRVFYLDPEVTGALQKDAIHLRRLISILDYLPQMG